MGGLFFDFGAVRAASRDHGAHTGGSSGAPVVLKVVSTTTGRTWSNVLPVMIGLMMVVLLLDCGASAALRS